MQRTQWLLTLILALSLLTASCASHKPYIPPVPQAVPQIVEAITKDKTLTPDQKTELLKQAINATERFYEQLLVRYEDEGKNIKDVIVQSIGLMATIATLIWTVKK